MAITLGLNTALSGLLTSQRALDTIAQNVTNVNTEGYVRKVINQESRVLNGQGAGVQVGSVVRQVNEGLLKDIRRETSTLGQLETEQDYYPRIDDLFGNVADNTSIAHRVNDLNDSFEQLANDVTKPSTQWSTVQGAQDVADQLDNMTSQLQSLRQQADKQIEDTVGLINDKLSSIHDLNQKIVKNGAIATGTSDLEDKRDQAITDLSKLVDVRYYKRNDGSMIVYTTSGEMLVDNQDQPLSYSANSQIDSWMTAAGGQFNTISVEGGTDDLGPKVKSGQLRSLLDIRDGKITDLQASLDELALSMRENVNQSHNRGTSYPNPSHYYEGTRVFAQQGDIVPDAADSSAPFYAGSTTLDASDYGTLTVAASTGNPWQSTMTASAGTPFSALGAGDTFSVSGANTSRNDGTYRVVSIGGGGANMTVEKVNPRQTIQLTSPQDVVLATFDSDGEQTYQTTLNTIMQTDYSGSYTSSTVGSGRSLADFAAKGDHDQWAVNEVSAHVEGWLQSIGYTNASVNLNDEGKMVMDLGVTTDSLAFRDQTGATGGADQSDATIAFDVDGDGAVDQTVSGFANFFGLNDFFVSSTQNSIFDSAIQDEDYKTTSTRTLSILDGTGQLGETMQVPAGSSLQDIADSINKSTRTTESALLSSTGGLTLTTAATITVSNGNGTASSTSVGPGSVSLEEIAGKLTSGSVVGSVVQDGDGYRLRLHSTAGQELTVSISGGGLSNGSSLDSTLNMSKQNRIHAAVIPEGSGTRLRIVDAQSEEIYVSSDLDTRSQNLLSDIGLERAATRSAGTLAVRSDLMTAPEKMSRGVMQWNSDLGRYYVSEGDNTTALDLAATMTDKRAIGTAGGLYAGHYSFSEYAAASISLVASNASHSADQYSYQKNLNEALDFQNTSFSGVNLDEEVSSMVDYQQAYSASAKVITTLQDMMETLTSMIR